MDQCNIDSSANIISEFPKYRGSEQWECKFISPNRNSNLYRILDIICSHSNVAKDYSCFDLLRMPYCMSHHALWKEIYTTRTLLLKFELRFKLLEISKTWKVYGYQFLCRLVYHCGGNRCVWGLHLIHFEFAYRYVWKLV